MFDWLAGAGGFEPPNGGIKIRHAGPPITARTSRKYEFPLFVIDLPRQAPTIILSNSKRGADKVPTRGITSCPLI